MLNDHMLFSQSWKTEFLSHLAIVLYMTVLTENLRMEQGGRMWWYHYKDHLLVFHCCFPRAFLVHNIQAHKKKWSLATKTILSKVNTDYFLVKYTENSVTKKKKYFQVLSWIKCCFAVSVHKKTQAIFSVIKFLLLLVGQWSKIEHNPHKWLWTDNVLSMAYK